MSKIAFGAVALAAANMVRVIAQALVVPLLARFITPADFGLVAVASPFLALVLVFSDAGVGMSLLRSKSDIEDLWSTAFWFVLSIGVVLSCLLVAVGPIAAWAFDEPILTSILSALAIIPLLQGLVAVPSTKIYQRERLTYLAAVESLSTLVGAAVAIAMALTGAGLWALVAQQLGYWLVKFTGIFIAADFAPTIRFDRRLLQGHVKFGRDQIAFRLIDFFSRGADPLVVGKFLGVEAAGYFTLATQIVRLPRMLLLGPINTAVYPRLIRVHEDLVELRSIFLAATRILAAVIFSSMAFAAVESQTIFSIALSDRWAPAATLFSLLVPVNALMAVTSLNGTVLMAINRTDVQVLTSAEYTLLRLAILCSTAWGGLEALALGLNAAFGLYFYRFTRLFLPTINCDLPQFFGSLLRPAALAILFAGLHATIVWQLDPSYGARLLLGITLLIACWAATFLIMRKTFLSDLVVLRRNFAG